MLTIYPRHVAACRFFHRKTLTPMELRSEKFCGCPLWIMGKDPRGEYHRRTLQTASWEVAEKIKRDLELGVEHPKKVTIADAATKWKDALLAAKRKPQSVERVYGMMTKSLEHWAAHTGLVHLDELGLEELNAWVSTWNYASTTHRNRISRARQFFEFCISHKWVKENPALSLIQPVADHEPTLPFTAEEEAALFEAATRFSQRQGHRNGLWSLHAETARALLLVLRWTGLRASDAIRFEPRNMRLTEVDGQAVVLYGTYQTKTGEWVMCPIPPAIAQVIGDAPRFSEKHAFLPLAEWGYDTDTFGVCNSYYAGYLDPLGRLAGVANVHAHRFRDTFAVRLLEASKPLEIVQMLLGHSSIKTTEKHYSPWVRSRQQLLIREVMSSWH